MVRFDLNVDNLKRFFAVVLATTMLTACGGSLSQLPVAKIEQPNWQHTINLQEFESQYQDGTFSTDAARDSSFNAYQAFLKKYIDFRLKVQDAIDRRFDKDARLLDELQQYRKQLAEPYLMEKAVIEKNLHDLYEKQKEEINASHILTLASSSAKPADTLKAYKKIMQARQLILDGAPFDSVALTFSEDPSAKHNKGNLGYFSGGMMVYQFEDAAYGEKVGKLAGPFRTRYGYHILKIHDRRPRTQPIRASHIMVGVSKVATPSDTLKAYQKAQSILQKLHNGADFAALAKNTSDDKASGSRGGDLGLFGLNRMVKPFENAAFALKNIGDLSPIVRTPFGYHIIQLTGRETPKSYAESKDLLKRLLNRNSEKLKHEKTLFIRKLKKTYQFKENDAALSVLTSKIDSTATFALLDSLDEKSLETNLFTFAKDQKHTLKDFKIFMQRFGGKKSPLTKASLKQYAKQFADETIKAYEIAHMEARYAEFAQLMENYRNGVLLFKASEETVWKKAGATDSAGLAYYEKHKHDFRFEHRVKVSEIVVAEKPLAEALYQELSEKKRTRDMLSARDVRLKQRKIQAQLRKLSRRRDKNSQLKRKKLQDQLALLKVDTAPRSFQAIAKRYSQTVDTSGQAKSEVFERGKNRQVDALFAHAAGFILAPVKANEKYKILRLDEVLPPTEKSYEEARTEIFSILQEQNTKALEENWVKQLRQKSRITIFEDNLKQAFKQE